MVERIFLDTPNFVALTRALRRWRELLLRRTSEAPLIKELAREFPLDKQYCDKATKIARSAFCVCLLCYVHHIREQNTTSRHKKKQNRRVVPSDVFF
jgi:hypothetical protein